MVGRSKLKEWIRAAFVTSLAFVPAFAFATGGDRIPGSRYVSGRGAALGDAYIGLGDTMADGLFYNPAAIGKVGGLVVEPLNISLQANSKLGSMFNQDFYKFHSLSGYRSSLEAHPGTNPGGGFAVLPSFGFRGFGFGVLYQSRLMAETDGTNIRYRSVYQLIPAAGFGLRLASGVLRIGYVIQWVNQASGDKTVTTTATPLDWKEGLSEGKGFSHNLGMTLTLPYIHQPTISVVARNLTGLKLTGKPLMSLASNPVGEPAKEEMSLDGSIGFITKFGGGTQIATQFAYRDALNSSDTRTIAHLSTGVELTFVDIFSLRGGFGSGYPTAGLGLKRKHGEANFAWYSEDLGDGSTPVRDIRYIMQFIFRAL